jgi:DNA-binding NarL/FixJ family response regulator
MQNIKVLVADDHQLFREGMESLLRKIPFISEIQHASDGHQVMGVMERTPCDIIFMDIRMPERNGIDTTRAVTQQYPDTRVIALTMMEDSFSVVNMFRAGAKGYLLKNTSFTELKEAIECVLGNRRFFSKNISNNIMDTLVTTRSRTADLNKRFDLTEREKEIVGLICRGFSSKEVADILEISFRTVDTHRSNIYSKLNVSNIADLTFYAIENGLVSWGS